jgi:hypothetical protein
MQWNRGLILLGLAAVFSVILGVLLAKFTQDEPVASKKDGGGTSFGPWHPAHPLNPTRINRPWSRSGR